MRDDPSPHQQKRSAGGYALAFGFAAVACALIPVIGDFISAPIAAAAIVFGVIGIGHHDAGRTPRILPAAAGTALGALALFIVALMFIATRAPF